MRSGLGVGQRADNCGVDDAVDRRGAADGECKRGHRDEREAGRTAHLAKGIAEILEERTHNVASPPSAR